MPDVVKNARIKLRTDSQSNWENSSYEDPQLLSGEIGYSIDQRILKIGDSNNSSSSWYTSTQLAVSGSLPYNKTPFELGSGAYMIDYGSIFNNSASICYLSSIPKAIRDPGTNETWGSAASLKAMCTSTTESGGSLVPSGELVSRLLTTPTSSGGSITPPQTKAVGYYYGNGGLLLINLRGSAKDTLAIDEITPVDTVFQKLVVAGYCHLEINSDVLDYVGNSGNTLTYEIYERVLSRSSLQELIYASPWKLVDSSYSGSSTVEFITDSEIEEIIGVELEYANGHSF